MVQRKQEHVKSKNSNSENQKVERWLPYAGEWNNGITSVKGSKLAVSSGDLMYNMVFIVNNTVFNLEICKEIRS